MAAHKGGMVFGSGLVELGLEPDRFIFIIVGDITALLRAADDILRCGGAGALIVEVWGSAPALNLTASRRLALAAEKSGVRSEEHTSELQSLMRISYAVFCLKKKKRNI